MQTALIGMLIAYRKVYLRYPNVLLTVNEYQLYCCVESQYMHL